MRNRDLTKRAPAQPARPDAGDDLAVRVEQYKCYINSAERLADRGDAFNRRYMTLLAGIAAAMAFMFNANTHPNLRTTMLVALCFVGVFLSGLLLASVRAVEAEARAMWERVREVEARLPEKGYIQTHAFSKDNLKKNKVYQLSKLEQVRCTVIYFGFVVLFVAILVSEVFFNH